MAAIGAIWAAVNALGRIEAVRKNYASLAEAKADRLFERGWLPDVLPPSARDIQTSNNLDLNTSEGRFSYLASEYPIFAARTRPAAASRLASEKLSKGFTVRELSESESTWLFFCKPELGYCEYVLRTTRG